ncbi:hypothetical protein KEJ32_07285, partial [Candidatus Bathyarchaeota archaeon]|nr:hypothetical protein [Candidatus Bathyarchaeota archaeon]
MVAAVEEAFYFGVIRAEEVIENQYTLVEGERSLRQYFSILKDTDVQNISIEKNMAAPGIWRKSA